MASVPTRIGKYEVSSRIGKGGMGMLYLARDPDLDRLVAIKVMLEVEDADLRARFLREARSAARLRHANIVTVFEVGEHEGQPFIAMEYIAGESLAELIRRRAALPVVRKLQILEEACAGLGHAHRNGIVHRDIKPPNVMLDAEGTVRIVDFGIARLANAKTVTQEGSLIGSLNYMSPEQLRGRAVDHRSDVFSLGALAYELMAYRQAFPGTLADGLMYRIVHDPPEPLRSAVPDLDPEIERVINMALEKDPERRHRDLSLMRRELSRIRSRLDASGDTTIVMPLGEQPTVVSPRRAATPGPRGSDREGLAKRRTEQIARYLDDARAALAQEQIERAIDLGEQAALLDPDDQNVDQLLSRARAALDARQASQLLSEARASLAQGALTQAGQVIAQALALDAASTDARALQAELARTEEERERARQRAEARRLALERSEARLAEGALESALRSADEALAIDETDADAIDLKARVEAALDARRVAEEQERRRREAERERQRREEELMRRVQDAVAEARRLFDAGEHSSALAVLHAFELPHPIISEAVEALQAELTAIDAARAAEERRRRAEQLAALVELGRSQLANADLEAADETAKQALALDPTDSAVLSLRSDVAAAVAARREQEALARAEAERRRRAEQIAELIGAATASLADGDLARADGTVRQALALEPTDGAAQALLAEIAAAIEAQEREAAERRRAELEKAARLRAAADRLANARKLLRKRRFDEAITALEQIAPDGADAAEIQSLLAAARADRDARLNAQQTAAQIEHALGQADGFLRSGDFSAAQERIDASLALDPTSGSALAMQRRLQEAVAEKERRTAAEALKLLRRHQAALEREQMRPAGPAVLESAPERRTAVARLLERRTLLASIVAGVLATAAVAWLALGRPVPEELPPTRATGIDIVLPAPPPPPKGATPLSGTLEIDAAPWGEIVRISNERGEAVAIEGPRYTPAALQLPSGLYTVLLRHPSARAAVPVQASVRAGEIARVAPPILRQIDPTAFLKKVAQ